LPDSEQRNSSGVYYRALLAWDNELFEKREKRCHFLLVPFASSSGWTVLVGLGARRRLRMILNILGG
jgi:hypothetical protein